MASKGWIGVDLDGTLAYYEDWVSILHIGAPIAPMVERVKEWLRKGYEVKIFTARVADLDDESCHRFQEELDGWCLSAGLPPLQATCVKDLRMVALWDDRARQVERNTGHYIGGLIMGEPDV